MPSYFWSTKIPDLEVVVESRTIASGRGIKNPIARIIKSWKNIKQKN